MPFTCRNRSSSSTSSIRGSKWAWQSMIIAGRISGQPARHVGMRGAEPTVHSVGLAIDVARVVAREEGRHRSDLARFAPALQRVKLPDLVLFSGSARTVVDR